MANDKPIIGKQQNSIGKNFGGIIESPFFWIFFVALAFGVPLFRSLSQKQPEIPPVLGQVENFSLVNQNNKSVQFTDFAGSVVVANFIFTSCPDTCPMLTKQMAKLQSRLMGVGPAVKLLSISVDPKTDTPDVLKAYAEKYKADHKIWHFLTGPMDNIQKAVVDGFKVAFENPGAQNPAEKGAELTLMEITHGEHFVIVDQKGQIRAYKHARTTEELNEIVRLVAILANLPNAPAPVVNAR
jgi:protein SCO1/2